MPSIAAQPPAGVTLTPAAGVPTHWTGRHDGGMLRGVSKFVADIRRALAQGLLPERFRGADVREACPGWADRTYTNFLPKHRVGNPTGQRAYFVQHDDGSYSLL